MASGWVSSAISSTQSRSFLLVVGALVVSIVIWVGRPRSISTGGIRALCHTRRNPAERSRSSASERNFVQIPRCTGIQTLGLRERDGEQLARKHGQQG